MMQLTLELEFFKSLLPQGFVADDGYGITQVQGPDPVKHGDPDTGFFRLHQDLFGDTGTFFTKHDVTPVFVGDICVSLF